MPSWQRGDDSCLSGEGRGGAKGESFPWITMFRKHIVLWLLRYFVIEVIINFQHGFCALFPCFKNLQKLKGTEKGKFLGHRHATFKG